MGAKVKGLLKGLKQIFEDEKEPEMEIGFPTDVKHVAHIGWDGPSASSPSWMNEFKSPPELLNGPSNQPAEAKNPSTNPPAQDCSQSEKVKPRTRRPPSAATGSPSSSLARKSSTDAPRHSRRQLSAGTGSPVSSPRGSNAPKPSRRHKSVPNMSMDYPDRDSSVKSRSSEQNQKNTGAESPVHEQPAIPKHSRVRKSKGSSSGGSSKSSRSKDQNSSADAIATENGSEESESRKGTMNTASPPSPVLEAYE